MRRTKKVFLGTFVMIDKSTPAERRTTWNKKIAFELHYEKGRERKSKHLILKIRFR